MTLSFAITGASGYIGKRLIHFALQDKFKILALSRTPVKIKNVDWKYFDLNNLNNFSLSHHIDIIFHLASCTNYDLIDEDAEIRSLKIILEQAKLINAKFVLLSSQTASPSSATNYGRLKWILETITLNSGGFVVRAGFVYGRNNSGLFGNLCKYVNNSFFLPVIIPSPKIQLIHVDDLANALIKCANVNLPRKIYIADPAGISFNYFLRIISMTKSKKCHIFIPFPSFLINFLFFVSSENIKNKYNLHRLKSLISLMPMRTNVSIKKLNLSLRPLFYGLSKSGSSRRELLVESKLMLSYIFCKNPKFDLMKRYVRVVELYESNRALYFPLIFYKFPILLSLVDNSSNINKIFIGKFQWRINAAMIIAESSPDGALRFLGPKIPDPSFVKFFLILKSLFVYYFFYFFTFLFNIYWKGIVKDKVYK